MAIVDPLEFVAGCSIVATGSMEQRAECTLQVPIIIIIIIIIIQCSYFLVIFLPV